MCEEEVVKVQRQLEKIIKDDSSVSINAAPHADFLK